MGLAAPYTGEGEITTLAETFEPEANIDDAEEALVCGIFATLIEAVHQAQISGNARNRLGERFLDANGDANAPIAAQLLMQIATVASKVRNELLNTMATMSAANLVATDGEAHDWTNLGPLH